MDLATQENARGLLDEAAELIEQGMDGGDADERRARWLADYRETAPKMSQGEPSDVSGS